MEKYFGYYIGLRGGESGYPISETFYDTQEEAEKMFKELKHAMEIIDTVCDGTGTLCGYLSIEDENGDRETIDWC